MDMAGSRGDERRLSPADAHPPGWYHADAKYGQWIEDYLSVIPSLTQQEIIDTIAENQRVLIVGGNGFGKTYILACFSLAFLNVNYPTTVIATSGTYQKLKRTYCDPIESLHGDIASYVPGRYLLNPPRIETSDPEHYLEAAAPQDSGELEGVHNEHLLAVIEEADKDRVDADMIDSLESLLTDANDKIVAVANPPRDETNIVYRMMQSDAWTTLQYSSFDAFNVQLEMTHEDPYERDADGSVVIDDVLQYPKLKSSVEDKMIPEMTRLSQIKQDWESWNGESWPVEEGGGWQGAAQIAADSWQRDDLSVQWYRRRLGEIPPQAADALRPFTVDDVETSYIDTQTVPPTQPPDGLGWDVARGAGTAADGNVLAGVFGDEIRVLETWKYGNHVDNERIVRDNIDESAWRCDFAIDSIGSGSGSADRVNEWYPSVERFKAKANAYNAEEYGNKWTEGVCLLGEFLQDGGTIRNGRLRTELLAGAREITLEEKYSKAYDANRYHASPKDDVAGRLNQSPDYLDAAYMAVAMASAETDSVQTVPGSYF